MEIRTPTPTSARSHQLVERRSFCSLGLNPSFSMRIAGIGSRRLTTTSTGVTPTA